MRAAVREACDLTTEAIELSARYGTEDLQVNTTMHVHTAAAERNMQCLLAYHFHRLHRLEEVRWRSGAVLPAEVRSQLDAREVDYFRTYGAAITAYMGEVGLVLTAVSGWRRR